MAYVYTPAGMEEGFGGGICQVASTLHLAAVYSGLDITERGNHSYTVTYVPLGLDAAIAAPSLDLKFRNPTSMPIKITGYLKNNNLYFSIIGTNEHPNRKISLIGQKLNEVPFSERFIDDPTLNVGVSINRK